MLRYDVAQEGVLTCLAFYDQHIAAAESSTLLLHLAWLRGAQAETPVVSMPHGMMFMPDVSRIMQTCCTKLW